MMKTREEAVKWIMAQKGKGIDKDRHYGFQCVDLIVAYLEDCLQVKSPHGNAKEWVHLPLPQGFIRTKNTPDFLPLPGDIVVWDNGTPYGHIGLVVKADLNTFTSMEQNLVNNITTGSPAELVHHTNWGNTWFIRPPFAEEKKNVSSAKNSHLATYRRITSHRNSPRTHAIDRITPHCIVGQWTAKQGVDYFATVNRDVSANYVIGKSGDIGISVDEGDRSWCSSSSENDHRAITIECASDRQHPYTMTSEVFESLVRLCTDICRRHRKKKLLWFGDKQKSLSYRPKSDEIVITVHRWFSHTSCPGDWLYARLGILSERVTKELGGSETSPSTNKQHDTGGIFNARVTCDVLNVRKGAGIQYPIVKQLKKGGVYTVTEEKNGWGRLKSCKDWWICLEYTKKEKI